VVPALVVTKEDCPWCDKLKDTLRTEGITYEEISKQEAVEKGYWNPEWKTVPQMWLYKRHVGGYTDYINSKQQAKEQTYADCLSCEA
jgi:glutaredoxin